jgi:DNA-binding CsgD family transcriptional regulator
VLYGIVREQGRALGQLSLYRPKSAPTFAAAEEGELAGVMRYVAHGVSRRTPDTAVSAAVVEAAEDAIFVVTPSGGIESLSPAAHKLLALAVQGGLRPGPSGSLGDAARRVLARLREQLQGALAGADVEPPGVVIDNAWGRFRLRAYALAEDPTARDAPMAVRIQRQEPMLLKFVDALRGLGLSPQQREIAAGLARGASNQELAAALGVSANTIAYHIKQLFARLDTHDRQQMVGKVLGKSEARH